MLFAKNSAVLHWCWVPAHICEEQISIGLFAQPQIFCEPDLQALFGNRVRKIVPSLSFDCLLGHLWKI